MLINGCEGIGTGYSTFIPNFNPMDVVNNLRRLLQGEELEPMHPWYRGFTGKVVQQESGGGYVLQGRIELPVSGEATVV